jgi:hypothetical protein
MTLQPFSENFAATWRLMYAGGNGTQFDVSASWKGAVEVALRCIFEQKGALHLYEGVKGTEWGMRMAEFEGLLPILGVSTKTTEGKKRKHSSDVEASYIIPSPAFAQNPIECYKYYFEQEPTWQRPSRSSMARVGMPCKPISGYGLWRELMGGRIAAAHAGLQQADLDKLLLVMWEGLGRTVKEVYLAREMRAQDLYEEVPVPLFGARFSIPPRF